MCYPGTVVPDDICREAYRVMSRQVNMIGTHTHDEHGEGGFENEQKIERDVLKKISSLFSSEPLDGYFCSGGTEANFMGLWIARERSERSGERQRDEKADEMKRGERSSVVYCSEATHYSITKACQILSLELVRCEMNERFELILPPLDPNNFNIVVVNMGSTTYGSIDPIPTQEHIDFIHMDASFGGMVQCFYTDEKWLDDPRIFTMALDLHKMAQQPYQSGVFLCKKGLQKLVTTNVRYIRSGHDDTFLGSRSFVPAACANLYFRDGFERQRNYVVGILIKKVLAHYLLNKTKGVTVCPHSPRMNIIPIMILKNGCQLSQEDLDSDLLRPYMLRFDEYKGQRYYKIVIMSHHTPKQIETFVADLNTFLNEMI